MSNRTNKDINKIVGLQLRETREKAKITQKELAEYIKIGKNHIHQVETGQSKASVEILLGYCDRLGTTPNEILGFATGNIIPELASRLSSMTACEQEKLLQILDIIYQKDK